MHVTSVEDVNLSHDYGRRSTRAWLDQRWRDSIQFMAAAIFSSVAANCSSVLPSRMDASPRSMLTSNFAKQ